jgi:hypothetical protein
VFPEAGGMGVRPIYAGVAEGGYALVHFKLPPGLGPGWHEVRLRTKSSAPSNGMAIAVDLETSAGRLEIKGASDGVTWEAGRVSAAHGFLSLWAEGLPENADIHNVAVCIADRPQGVTFVGPADAKGARQINARLGKVGPGRHGLRVGFGETRSPEVEFEVVT